MKVLLLHNTYRDAGGEDQVHRAERALLESRGHDVLVYARDNHEIDGYGPLQKAALALKTSWAWDTHAELGQLLARERPDVAHFTNVFPLISPAAYYACWRARVPVVQSVHNYRLVCPAATLYRAGKVCEQCVGTGPWNGVRHGCYRASRAQTAVVGIQLSLHRKLGTYARRVQRYVALTQFAKDMLVRGGLPAERIAIKPNFVTPAPATRDSCGDFALFVGRLAPEKGLHTLLDAFARLSVPLRVLGDGPLRDELTERARHMPHVHIEGAQPREAVFAALRGARLLVFPSEWHEVMPMVLLEAFACGTPVLAAALGATRELLREGALGALYRAGDANELARAVREVWANPAAAQARARAAQEDYARHYTGAANHAQLMTIYAEAREQLMRDLVQGPG